jgi:hypothetical protein
MDEKNTLPLRHENRFFLVRPDFLLVREIEGELGGLAALRERFLCNGWRVSDLVTLMQILLQAAGNTVDYVSLGDEMLRAGLPPYLAAAQAFLDIVLHAE